MPFGEDELGGFPQGAWESRRENWRQLKADYKRMTPLQRATGRAIWRSILVIVIIAVIRHVLPGNFQTKALSVSLDVLMIFPMIALIWSLARYLSLEQDGFIRQLVVRAVLWGTAVMVVGDAVHAALWHWTSVWRLDPSDLTLMNFDLFFATVFIAICIQWRGNR